MFENIEIFRMSSAMAAHAGGQQALVAQNVAHADTPGYHAQSLPEFANVYHPENAPLSQRATRRQHLNGVPGGSGRMAVVETGAGASPNDNSVSLEAEMLKSTRAKSQHDRALAIYKSALNVMRTAIRSQG